MSFSHFSGFLITALLIEEFSKNHEIDLVGFFRRRFYRIVPPVVLMVLVTMPFTFLVRQDYVAGIGGQIAGVLGFMTNFYELLTGGSYESQFHFLICLFIIGAWLLRYTTIFFGDWQFGSYLNSPNQMVSWGEWFFSYQLLPFLNQLLLHVYW